ncbi:extracellular solute-binding protein [Cohnella sp. GCM10012308]|uniref:sugar ABC transporter substrate-binding protein n=1 Tax=Cohnella sp. GCM10012308 TaxID=3317329 RepID=UPI0036194FCC
MEKSNIVRLTLWHEFDGPGDTSVETLEEICRRFAQRENIQIALETMSLRELSERLKRTAQTGAAPDMALVPADMAAFAEAALLSEAPFADFEREIGTDILEAMAVGRKVYGVPVLTGNHLVMYVNKSVLAEAPASWDELERSAPVLAGQGIAPLGGDLAQSYWFMPFYMAFGGKLPGNGDDREAAMRQALDFVREKLARGTLVSLDGSTALLERFAAGKLAAMIGGEWVYNHLDRLLGDRLQVAALPAIEGMPAPALRSSIGLVYPNDSLHSPRRQAILAFTRYMLSEDIQLLWAEAAQRIPAGQAARKRLAAQSDPNRAAILGLLDGAVAVPNDPAMIGFWSAVERRLAVLRDEPAQALASAAQEQPDSCITEEKHRDPDTFIFNREAFE